MKKWFVSVSLLAAAVMSTQVFATDQAVLDRYAKTCALCHGSGAAGAPKAGDAEQWAPRLKQGIDTLISHAKNGFKAMPPKGMCFDCSDDDFRALITYMSTGKGK